MRRSSVVVVLFAGVLLAGCGGSSAKTPTHSSIPTRLFRIPSSAMEPTLLCATGPEAPGCTGKADDLVVVQLSGAKGLKRGDIAVFRTPPEAAMKCGEGGIFVKRVIGLSGETVREDKHGFIDIDGKQLNEPYISSAARQGDNFHFGVTWHVPQGDYFVMGDSRSESCDSRTWGGVPARNVIGPVTGIVRSGKTLPVS